MATGTINHGKEGAGVAQIPSYNDLFGFNNYAACDSERSILSPAAYFVDLMRLQGSTIVQENTKFQLQSRRPDLWEIVLSSENTKEEISKLEIVNKVLQEQLKQVTALSNTSTAVYPLNLPFNESLHQIRCILQKHEISISDIWSHFGFNTHMIASSDLQKSPSDNQKESLACEILGISNEQWAICQTPANLTTGTVCKNYGIEVLSDNCKELSAIKTFLTHTCLDNEQLVKLLQQDLSPKEISAGLQMDFFINANTSGISYPITIDYSNDTITNLTLDRLDRINRFVRLSFATGWTFTELDWCLRTVANILSADNDSSTPAIDNSCLPYLAWIKQTQQKLNCSVYELTGLLGSLKNYGNENGSTFFDQIFNNSGLLSIPSSGTPLSWNVPKPDSTSNSSTDSNTTQTDTNQGHQISIALSAALKISQDELILLAQEILDQNNFTDQQLSLTPSNLAILYRLSTLPQVTGFTLKQLTTPGLFTELKNTFQQTTNQSGLIAYKGLTQLIELAKKIQSSPISLSLFQYLITGEGLNTDFQNQTLGKETICNFLTALVASLKPTLLSESELLKNYQELHNKDNNFNTFYQELISSLSDNTTTQSFLSEGIVLKIPSEEEVTNWLLSINKNLESDITGVKNISVSLVQLLSQHRSVQQNVFIQHLAGLYGVSFQFFPILLERLSVKLSDLWSAIQQFNPTSYTNEGNIQNINFQLAETLTSPLRLLQRYALFIQCIDISPIELQSFLNHLEYYNADKTASNDDNSLFSLDNMLSIINLKNLIVEFNDSQNHLINYFNYANPNNYTQEATPPTIPQISNRLANITGWNASQIETLINEHQLDTIVSTQKTQSSSLDANSIRQVETITTTTIKPQPIYATVSGLIQLKAYFDLSSLLGIDIQTMILVKNWETGKEDSSDLGNLSDSLLAGFKATNSSANIVKLTNQLNEAKRDALVPLLIHQLNSKSDLNLASAKDLYEYLLIDVEVEGIVQTSSIKEAISAVQLYIYRCLNNLEPGANITEANGINLEQWWGWMNHYRNWQANREIFLYPENYLQPQLRKNKTLQYAQLINDLQQADLTNSESAENTFNKYIDSINQIANLEIIGCSSYDFTTEENNHKKIMRNLCFIGKTRNSPHAYFYLTAEFMYSGSQNSAENSISTEQFLPVSWSAWMPITCQLQPDGEVSPVFAFGKWYIFWVEKQQQGKSDSGSSTGTGVNTYSALIKFSHLNSNNHWVNTLSLGQTTYLGGTTSLSSLMVRSINQIMVIYGGPDNCVFFQLSPQDDIKPLAYFPFASAKFAFIPSPNPFPLYTGKNYFQNLLPFGKLPLQVAKVKGISLWFRLNNTQNTPGIVSILDDSTDDTAKSLIAMDQSQTLQLSGTVLKDQTGNNAIVTDGWNHLYVGINWGGNRLDLSQTESTQSFAFLFKDNTIHAFAPDSKGNLSYSKEVNNSLINQGVISGAEMNHGLRPSVIEYNNQIYLAFKDNASTPNLIIGTVDLQNMTFHQMFRKSSDMSHSPTLGISNNKLDVLWPTSYNNVYYWKNCLSGTSAAVRLKDDSDYNCNGIISYATITTSSGTEKVVITFPTDGEELHVMVLKEFENTNDGRGDIKDHGFTQIRNKSVSTLVNDPVFVKKGNSLSIIWNNSNKLYQASVIIPDNKEAIEISSPTSMGFTSNEQFTFRISTDQIGAGFIQSGSKEEVVFVNTDTFKNEIYLNGEALSTSIPTWAYLGVDEFSLGGETFSGDMMEVIFFEDNKVLKNWNIHSLYQNTKEFFAEKSEPGVPVTQVLNRSVTASPIISQPNWNIVRQNGATYLCFPYTRDEQIQMSCIRLNSTAVNELAQKLNMKGIPALLSIESQQSEEISFSNLSPNNDYFQPETKPLDTIDLFRGPMAKYFWELFFHAPLLVANTLQTHLQFQSAKNWYQYIFNPTINLSDTDQAQGASYPNSKFWRFLGLRALNNKTLKAEKENSPEENYIADLSNSPQLYAYHNDPFDAHAIAQLRPLAYQKAVVMRYTDNLINWGDQLFSVYSIEDITEAEMLYVMAYDMLGKKPAQIPGSPLPAPETLTGILSDSKKNLKEINEFLVNIDPGAGLNVPVKATPSNYIAGDYFGIPENTHFNGYRTTVKERLFDIRNSLNIKGVFDKPSLFQPAIDPKKSVAQNGSGQTLQTQIGQVKAGIPYHRFEVVLSKAKEVTQTVIQFGNTLLSALEKKDSVGLNNLYNINQQHILNMATASKQDALNQVTATVAALQQGLNMAKSREEHYSSLIQTGNIAEENNQINLEGSSIAFQTIARDAQSGVGVASLIPTIYGLADGGMNLSESAKAISNISKDIGNILSSAAGIAGLKATYKRRKHDWEFEKKQASDEIMQAASQLLSARYQERIASQELEQLHQNIFQEQKVTDFLKSKFTNEELYDWTIGKLSSLYFQAYQLASKLALQAQNAWQFEKGIELTKSFIQNGNWDTLHHGLLSGESLQLDLQRMESTYMNHSKRSMEIRKTVALPADTVAILNKTGSCQFSISEKMLDLDYPGHYCRQIKNLSISIPAVLGPYENVHATLQQTANKTVIKPSAQTVTDLLNAKSDPNDSSLKVDMRCNQQIAISSGLNDTGVFQLNFNDPRYLPFEGTGAVSSWKLDIPLNSNPSLVKANTPLSVEGSSQDNTAATLGLSEVIIELYYTAVDGGSSFAKSIETALSKNSSENPQNTIS